MCQERILQIGYRGGWPGTQMAKHVTHAVFRVRRMDGFEKHDQEYYDNKVKGYGKKQKTGQIVIDSQEISEDHQDYQWLQPHLVVTNNETRRFKQIVGEESAKLLYTGIGGNCYTPVIRGLEAIRKILKENENNEQVKKVDILLGKLLGSNYGMGGYITNKRIVAGAALLATAYLVWKRPQALTDLISRIKS